ncbi:MAG: flagellar basal-body MS-ring/collar protein FliF [Planctomycetota bacterium]|jgi:flagellar M-ring protein FliF
MSLVQKIRVIWQNVSLTQRALLTAVVLTFILVGALLVHWARKPDMRLLYQDLAAEEASKITEKIREQGIPYELRNSGTAIFVPQEKVYQLRLDMAKEGLPSGEQSGYRLFDNEPIGTSPFVQGVNLKRALQEEVAKSIQMIDGVAHARVHIVRSEQTLFTHDAGKTSASVVLRLQPGYRLSELNVAAITHLVSGSVEGLGSENVTVIDSQGRLLSGESDPTMTNGANTVQDYRERVEQNLASKVEEMLTAVLGPGRSTVKVSAVIDMNSTNVVTKKYEPKGVAIKEEIKKKQKTEPGSTPAEGEAPTPGGTEHDNTIISEYAFGETVETRADLPGEIKSLSVAAFVDLSSADANETGTEGQPAGLLQVSDVEEIIKKALGLKETDSLKVVPAKFHRPAELLTEEEPSNWPRYIAIARQASLGIMAICALLVLRIFSGVKRKAPPAAGAKLPAAEEAAGLLPAGEENPLVLRKQISNALNSHPEQVRQLFSSWLEEEQE